MESSNQSLSPLHSNDFRPELLAPAGDPERMRYALAYGADAVYAGQPQFSLRARENGFNTPDDIAAAIDYCHNLKKKFYLASNIIPHNNKIPSFQKSLLDFAALKPDALIMTDPGMIAFMRKESPDTEIHLSVQANCTNWSTAQYWYDQGVTRVILSRELNLREIRQIREKVPGLELEVFVHGAICMAYSGRCMLSNYLSYRDANQGMCSNACRFEYELYQRNAPQSEEYVPLQEEYYLRESQAAPDELMPVDEDQYGTYFMNSKDMCAIELLSELRDAGIDSFKIEGRTKSIYYLSQVVGAYTGALDDLMAGKPLSQEHKDRVYSTDSRGYIPGFFIGGNKQPLNQPQNYETTKVIGQGSKVAALVRDYDPQTQTAQISVKGKFSAGQTLHLLSPGGNIPFEAKSLFNHKNQEVDTLNPGLENCRIALPQEPGAYSFITT